MPYNGEVLSVIIDPNHSRFAEIGELDVDPELLRTVGDVIIKFGDDSFALANNGELSGIPQYYVFAKSEQQYAEVLSSRLPKIKDLLHVIFARVEQSDVESTQENAQRAQAAAHLLINRTLFNDEVLV